ncbi:MAG: hypothetical protein ACRDFB_05410 [Rhabdochlamydiaceae bacterium]
MPVTQTCVKCKNPVEIDITPEQIKDWLNSGKIIQDCFPNLPASEREILLSGLCGECFEALWKDQKQGDSK